MTNPPSPRAGAPAPEMCATCGHAKDSHRLRSTSAQGSGVGTSPPVGEKDHCVECCITTKGHTATCRHQFAPALHVHEFTTPCVTAIANWQRMGCVCGNAFRDGPVAASAASESAPKIRLGPPDAATILRALDTDPEEPTYAELRSLLRQKEQENADLRKRLGMSE